MVVLCCFSNNYFVEWQPSFAEGLDRYVSGLEDVRIYGICILGVEVVEDVEGYFISD